MFEFLFHHPRAVFAKGEFAFLSRWPVWLLAVLAIGAAGAAGWWLWRRRTSLLPGFSWRRLAVIWLLQSAVLAVLLTLLWQPALRVSALKPQQNIVAVVVDDSRSMAIDDGGRSRTAHAVATLGDGLLDELSSRFQVRLYRLEADLERVSQMEAFQSRGNSTRIGEGLRQIVAESASLPIGAVVLLTDGAENAGGLEAETIAAIRGRRLPVHTIGFGRERFARDIEITDVQTADRALAGSRLTAQVTIRQTGYAGRKTRLSIRDGARVLASRDVELGADGALQTESVLYHAGSPGARRLEVTLDSMPEEENPANNAIARLVNVEDKRPRVLYLEGEPRWEYKFIRRALEQDKTLDLVSVLRTTQNKIYRQGIKDPKELEEGYPARVDELFGFQGLIIGTVEAGFFTAGQQDLIRQFVDRRGGGLLFLGGRASLSDGGYAASPLADVMPVVLPARKDTFRRGRAAARLTVAGSDSLITRLEDDAAANAKRWSALPELADYQYAGEPKPGATVLAEMTTVDGRDAPLLVMQNYGRGRTAVLATGGTWRWQMRQSLEDESHEVFWRQLLRWLVTGAPGRVAVSVPRQMLFDEAAVTLTATVRDNSYAPAADARVTARILGPGGSQETIEFTPHPREPGVYRAEWSTPGPGSFLSEVVAVRGEEEAGRDVVTFERMDGVAENFRAEQNRELLEKLSEQTGGRYYRPEEAGRLSEEISFSEAGITVRETHDLWNLPAVLLGLLLLKAAEWFLRRKWGVI